MTNSENSSKYYKNINQLYLNEFDIPEFNILKNYRLKLMNDENYVNDLLISLNMNGNYDNDIDILNEKIDILIYCTLIIKLLKIDKIKYSGLIFKYSNELNKNDKLNIKELKNKIKQYEPHDLRLIRKYNIFKIIDYLLNNDFEIKNEDKLIDLISDFHEFKSKNKDIDDLTIQSKICKYFETKFKC